MGEESWFGSRDGFVDGIAERIGFYESLGVLPIVIIRTAQQNPHIEIDVNQISGQQLAIDNDAGVTYMARPHSVMCSYL